MEVPTTILCCGKTRVMRLYMMRRQALTSQIVRICICSTTKTSLDPYIRVLTSASEYCEMSSPGGIRLLLVFVISCMMAMSTVSVAWPKSASTFAQRHGPQTIATRIK